MAKGRGFASIGRYLGIAVKLMTLDLVARSIDNVPNLPTGLRSVAKLGLTLARFPIMKKVTKGLPFGISAVVNGLMTISAVQIVITELPKLMEGFGVAQPSSSVGLSSATSETTGETRFLSEMLA